MPRGGQDSLKVVVLTRKALEALEKTANPMTLRLIKTIREAWRERDEAVGSLEIERAQWEARHKEEPPSAREELELTAELELEQELLTALFYGHEGPARYAYEHLERMDFQVEEHSQLFEELKTMSAENVPMSTATLKLWLLEGEGCERLRKAGGFSTRGVLDWLMTMHVKYPGLASHIRWNCFKLRERRLKLATEKAAREFKDNGKHQEWFSRQLERLNAIPRLEVQSCLEGLRGNQ